MSVSRQFRKFCAIFAQKTTSPYQFALYHLISTHGGSGITRYSGSWTNLVWGSFLPSYSHPPISLSPPLSFPPFSPSISSPSLSKGVLKITYCRTWVFMHFLWDRRAFNSRISTTDEKSTWNFIPRKIYEPVTFGPPSLYDCCATIDRYCTRVEMKTATVRRRKKKKLPSIVIVRQHCAYTT